LGRTRRLSGAVSSLSQASDCGLREAKLIGYGAPLRGLRCFALHLNVSRAENEAQFRSAAVSPRLAQLRAIGSRAIETGRGAPDSTPVTAFGNRPVTVAEACDSLKRFELLTARFVVWVGPLILLMSVTETAKSVARFSSWTGSAARAEPFFASFRGADDETSELLMVRPSRSSGPLTGPVCKIPQARHRSE
jgi:hypothetical protein